MKKLPQVLKVENLHQFERKHLESHKDDNEVVLEEFSVTATENVLLFASSLKGKTILKIADQDYQVQELVKVLNKMGAKIKYFRPAYF